MQSFRLCLLQYRGYAKCCKKIVNKIQNALLALVNSLLVCKDKSTFKKYLVKSQVV